MPQHHCRAIIDADWPAILSIQSEAYYEFAPEPEPVMRSKATYGPTTSFVAVDRGESIVAYCLAHPYPLYETAVLGVADSLPLAPSANLYLHDLAVRRASAGRGVAQVLVNQVISVARSTGYQTMSLVAVQQAAGFWTKMGFAPSLLGKLNESYASDATFMTRRL